MGGLLSPRLALLYTAELRLCEADIAVSQYEVGFGLEIITLASGDTMSQARELYRKLDVQSLLRLMENGWEIGRIFIFLSGYQPDVD